MSTKDVLDQCDDKASSEIRVLGVEEDLKFELTLKIASGVERPIRSIVAGSFEAKILGFQVADLPAPHASILMSANGITDVGELNEEKLLANLLSNKNAGARRVCLCLVRSKQEIRGKREEFLH